MADPHSRALAGAARPALSARQAQLRAALVAGLLGAALIFVGGFASLPALHDAAHDGRHSLAFPCH